MVNTDKSIWRPYLVFDGKSALKKEINAAAKKRPYVCRNQLSRMVYMFDNPDSMYEFLSRCNCVSHMRIDMKFCRKHKDMKGKLLYAKKVKK